MGAENGEVAASTNLHILALGIYYPAACIICILVLVQRIRKHQQRKYTLSSWKMDPPASPREKRGGEMPPHAANHAKSSPSAPSHNATSLPSACDILQPLSHSTRLPSSGHLASVLSHERAKKFPGLESQTRSPCHGPSGSSSGESGSSIAETEIGGSAYESDGSRSSVPGDPPQTGVSPTEWRAPPVSASEFSGMSSSHGTQSAQKRSQAAQILHDVDSEGPRTWRRLVVEYS